MQASAPFQLGGGRRYHACLEGIFPILTPEERIEVWYDGSCPICRRSRRWSERRDRDCRLSFRDFRAAGDEELPASRSRHEATMMVRLASGTLLEAFAAWRQILAVLPGWRWLARFTALPPLSWFGALGYRLVARWRHRLAASLRSATRRR